MAKANGVYRRNYGKRISKKRKTSPRKSGICWGCFEERPLTGGICRKCSYKNILAFKKLLRYFHIRQPTANLLRF